MYEISEKSTAIINQLIAGLSMENPAKKIDNRSGVFMAVCVELVDLTPDGTSFSIAHYYEQNGDLMRDPDMVFLKGHNNRFVPVSFQQDSIGLYQEAVTFDYRGGVESFNFVLQKKLAAFVDTWMNNIKEQQNLF